jgi:anti-sigma factor RsiW
MKEHLVIRDLLGLAAAHLLEPAEEEQVQKHLNHCEACRAELGEWSRLAEALQGLPIPQAPPRLVLQTQHLLSQAARAQKGQTSRLALALLVVFSWMVAFMTVGLVRMFDMPLARWLDVSSTTVWIAYVGITWFATAIAAGLLGKHWQQEGRTI